MLEPDFQSQEDGSVLKLSELAQRVCEKVQYDGGDEPNIEHFLSNCDAYLLFNNDEEVRRFVLDVKRAILQKCKDFVRDGRSDLGYHRLLLQKLARRRVRDPRLKIFTTNYDICFEKAASDLGIMVVDGFSFTHKRRFDSRFFDYDIVRRDNEANEFVEGVFHLYKLHGSVSWERSPEDNQIYEAENPAPDSVALIYPANGKYQQAFMQPHLEIFSRFIESLRKPNSCVIVSGFGFNDDHLAEPILSSIKSNPSLRLIVVDRDAASKIRNSEEAPCVRVVVASSW